MEQFGDNSQGSMKSFFDRVRHMAVACPARRSVRGSIMKRIGSWGAPRRVAYAHSGEHSYVTLHVGSDDIGGNVQFPVVALEKVLDGAIPTDLEGANEWLEANRDLVTGYVADHLTIGDAWPVVFGPHRVLARPAYTYLIFDLTVEVPTGAVPRMFMVGYDGIIHADDQHEALVIIKTWAGFGAARTLIEQRIETRAGFTEHRVAVAEPSTMGDVVGSTRFLAKKARGMARRVMKRLRG